MNIYTCYINANFLEEENTEKHFFICIKQVDEVRGSITVKSPNAGHGEPPKTFTFDNVFGMKSKQVDVYNQVARPIVDFVLEGYNGKYLGMTSNQTYINYIASFQSFKREMAS